MVVASIGGENANGTTTLQKYTIESYHTLTTTYQSCGENLCSHKYLYVNLYKIIFHIHIIIHTPIQDYSKGLDIKEWTSAFNHDGVISVGFHLSL